MAISIFSVLSMILVLSILYGEKTIANVGVKTRAALLSEEGLEAARSIRNSGFQNLADGTFGLSPTSGQWALSGTSDSSNNLTRKITIITDPTNSNLKKVESTVSWPQSFAVSGSISLFTYVSNWSKTQPSSWVSPTPVPSPLPDNIPGIKIQTQGNFAYVIRSNAGTNFFIIDITNSDVPQIKSSLTLPGEPTNIAVSGNYAYVSNTDNQQNMQIINVTNPASPIFNSGNSFKGIGNEPATGIFVVGNRAYLTREYKMISNSPTFYTIDISNPTSPKSLGYIRLQEPALGLPVSAFDVYVSGNYAFLASGFIQSGLGIIPYLQVIDISNNQPVLVKSVTTFNFSDWNFGNAVSVSGFGNKVLLGQEGPTNKIYAFDVSNPTAPVLRGNYNAQGRVNDIGFGSNDKYAYVASDASTQEFQLLDVSDLNNLVKVSSLDLAGALNGICYSPGKDRVFAVGNQANGQFLVIKPQ